MDCITKNDVIESILATYRQDLGNDFAQYRNHVYRVYNFAVPFFASAQDIKTLAVAAAFHDLGIWTHQTFDYLEPSIELARQYATDKNMGAATILEIETIINFHHKLTKIKTSKLAEIFRQADLVDLSAGIFRFGRSRKTIRMIKKAFPNKGFHLNLTRLFFKNIVKNPLSPLPMYKF
jgi:hypothetical protein